MESFTDVTDIGEDGNRLASLKYERKRVGISFVV